MGRTRREGLWRKRAALSLCLLLATILVVVTDTTPIIGDEQGNEVVELQWRTITSSVSAGAADGPRDYDAPRRYELHDEQQQRTLLTQAGTKTDEGLHPSTSESEHTISTPTSITTQLTPPSMGSRTTVTHVEPQDTTTTTIMPSVTATTPAATIIISAEAADDATEELSYGRQLSEDDAEGVGFISTPSSTTPEPLLVTHQAPSTPSSTSRFLTTTPTSVPTPAVSDSTAVPTPPHVVPSRAVYPVSRGSWYLWSTNAIIVLTLAMVLTLGGIIAAVVIAPCCAAQGRYFRSRHQTIESRSPSSGSSAPPSPGAMLPTHQGVLPSSPTYHTSPPPLQPGLAALPIIASRAPQTREADDLERMRMHEKERNNVQTLLRKQQEYIARRMMNNENEPPAQPTDESPLPSQGSRQQTIESHQSLSPFVGSAPPSPGAMSPTRGALPSPSPHHTSPPYLQPIGLALPIVASHAPQTEEANDLERMRMHEKERNNVQAILREQQAYIARRLNNPQAQPTDESPLPSQGPPSSDGHERSRLLDVERILNNMEQQALGNMAHRFDNATAQPTSRPAASQGLPFTDGHEHSHRHKLNDLESILKEVQENMARRG